jgi:hypothetical protein
MMTRQYTLCYVHMYIMVPKICIGNGITDPRRKQLVFLHFCLNHQSFKEYNGLWIMESGRFWRQVFLSTYLPNTFIGIGTTRVVSTGALPIVGRN